MRDWYRIWIQNYHIDNRINVLYNLNITEIGIEINTVFEIVNILLDLIIGGQILKWAKNLKSIIDENTPGYCPVCNSVNTGYSMHIIDDKTNMGFGVIWCNDCKNAFHI